jgi:hypothetical protein
LVCQAATAWMARATHRVMRTGDVVFIPANTYHLLRSDGFGVSLGFDVFPPDPDASPDRRRRLRSNGYLTAPPALPCVGDRDAPGFAAVAGSALEWCAEDDSQIAVFMRGRRVLFSDTPWLDEALRLLGSPHLQSGRSHRGHGPSGGLPADTVARPGPGSDPIDTGAPWLTLTLLPSSRPRPRGR